MNEESIPRFAPGVRLRFDKVRSAWALLAPERLLQPDEQAVAILELVDGQRTIGAIASDLAARYAAPREVIMTDVITMLADLAAKSMVRT